MLSFLQQCLGSSDKFRDFLFEMPDIESYNRDRFIGLTFSWFPSCSSAVSATRSSSHLLTINQRWTINFPGYDVVFSRVQFTTFQYCLHFRSNWTEGIFVSVHTVIAVLANGNLLLKYRQLNYNWIKLTVEHNCLVVRYMQTYIDTYIYIYTPCIIIDK